MWNFETIWLYKICMKKCAMWFSVHITFIISIGRGFIFESRKDYACCLRVQPETKVKNIRCLFVDHCMSWIGNEEVTSVLHLRKELLGNICIFYLRNICIFYCRKVWTLWFNLRRAFQTWLAQIKTAISKGEQGGQRQFCTLTLGGYRPKLVGAIPPAPSQTLSFEH